MRIDDYRDGRLYVTVTTLIEYHVMEDLTTHSYDVQRNEDDKDKFIIAVKKLKVE